MKQFAYVAGGHIHQSGTYRLANERQTLFRYPGSPEALNWKELGPRTVTWGSLVGGAIQLEEIAVQSRLYLAVTCDLSAAKTFEDVIDLVRKSLVEVDPEALCQVHLGGRVARQIVSDGVKITDCLQQMGYKYIFICDQTKPDFDLESLRGNSGVVGLFIRSLEEEMRQDVGQEEFLREVMYAGLEAMEIRS